MNHKDNKDNNAEMGTVPQNAAIILVATQSDYIAATELGFSAYTFGTAVAKLPKVFTEEIARKKAILYVCYGTDFSGEYHARILEKDAIRIELPLEHQLWRFDPATGKWKHTDGNTYQQAGTDGLTEIPTHSTLCDAIALGHDMHAHIRRTIDMKGPDVVLWGEPGDFAENLPIAHKSMMPFMEKGIFYRIPEQLTDSVGQPIPMIWEAAEKAENITYLLESPRPLQWSEKTDWQKWQSREVKTILALQEALSYIVDGPGKTAMIHLAQAKKPIGLADAAALNEDIESRAYSRKVLLTTGITKTSAPKMTKFFGGESPEDFYEAHRDTIGIRRFVFGKKIFQYDNETREVIMLKHQDADAYVRIGGDYSRFVPTLLKTDGDKMIPIMEIKKRSVSEIERDYGKVFVGEILKVDGLTIEPSNTEAYRRIIEVEHMGMHSKLLNLYEPMSWKPAPGRIDNTLRYLKHIFGGRGTATQNADGSVSEDNYKGDTFSIALDWVTLLITQPAQNIPVVLLVSKDQGTGKTTFGTLMNAIMGNNAISLKLADFMNNFNMIHAFKTLIVIDEALFNLEDKAGMTVLKNITTANNILATPKGIDSQLIPNNKKLIICNNDPNRPMKLDEDDTRYFVIKVPPIPKEELDPRLVSKMMEEIPALLDYLWKRKIFHENKTRMWFETDLIRTEQFWHIVAQTKAGYEKEILNFLKICFLDYKLTVLVTDFTTLMTFLTDQRFTKHKISPDQLKEFLRLHGYGKTEKHAEVRIPINISFPDEDSAPVIEYFRKKETAKPPVGRCYFLLASSFLTEEEMAELAEPFPIYAEKAAAAGKTKSGETSETVEGIPF